MESWLQHLLPNVINMGWLGDYGWQTSIIQTLYMTFWSGILGGLLGLIFGILLVVTDKGGIAPNRPVFWIADKIVSLFRAFPFIILLAIISPLTYSIIHTTIGPTAALIPLTLGVFGFYARQVQAVLENVDKGKIEAAHTVGADFIDIIFTVYLREELTALIRVSTVTLISLIGFTAMAGAIGAGGLGNTAITAYTNFQFDVTYVASIGILVLVFIVQIIGDGIAKRVSHR
ncbi:methionine ABC transporter permease [Lactococcus termiticola]|uniref:Methionine ABC transporter permease protein n=1 Tax=Lactococcus termiticola TaxID=2169526 RepID=A0A2R5HIA1_9LACT|nr:methionine ABC transporter permease [Lactococcus termiticola]GBG96008.1 methionine ABC transporter permease protein [Lactococcus termiticola]